MLASDWLIITHYDSITLSNIILLPKLLYNLLDNPNPQLYTQKTRGLVIRLLLPVYGSVNYINKLEELRCTGPISVLSSSKRKMSGSI